MPAGFQGSCLNTRPELLQRDVLACPLAQAAASGTLELASQVAQSEAFSYGHAMHDRWPDLCLNMAVGAGWPSRLGCNHGGSHISL